MIAGPGCWSEYIGTQLWGGSEEFTIADSIDTTVCRKQLCFLISLYDEKKYKMKITTGYKYKSASTDAWDY